MERVHQEEDENFSASSFLSISTSSLSSLFGTEEEKDEEEDEEEEGEDFITTTNTQERQYPPFAIAFSFVSENHGSTCCFSWSQVETKDDHGDEKTQHWRQHVLEQLQSVARLILHPLPINNVSVVTWMSLIESMKIVQYAYQRYAQRSWSLDSIQWFSHQLTLYLLQSIIFQHVSLPSVLLQCQQYLEEEFYHMFSSLVSCYDFLS